MSQATLKTLDADADALTRYILFADEAPLPNTGIKGDPAYIQDFLRKRRSTNAGISLRDLNLKTRLFEHRCSYMVYNLAFTGLPRELKTRVLKRIGLALDTTTPDPDFAYLPPSEKQAIKKILWETLPEVRDL